MNNVVSGNTASHINRDGSGEVFHQAPDIIPIKTIKGREKLLKFFDLYKENFGRLDFCSTCPDSIRIAVNKLNKKYGY